MSDYQGDFTAGKTVRVFFNTQDTAGAPITLATGTISVYKDGGTTESTAGVTLTADFDSRTGLHLVAIDTSADGTFYSAGSDFEIVITAGTVNSISVVGKTIGKFSLANRSALRPTTADRTLDVSAGGEAGLDWANVGGASTTLNLSGTTVKTATDVEADTQDIQSRLPAALISGRMDSNVQATASALTFNLTGNITGNVSGSVASVSGNVGGNVVGSVASVSSLTSAGIADAVWDEALSGHATAGSAGAALSAAGSAGDPWSSSLPGAYSAGQAGYILGTYLVGVVPTANQNADALLNRDMSAVTDSNSRSPLNALRFLRNKWSLSGTTLTVTKEDDSTTAFTATVSTNAAADPVVGSDPS